MKKYLKIVLCFMITVVILVTAGLVFRNKYVYLEKSFVARKTENIVVFLDKVNIKELNRCSEMKSMLTANATDDRFSQLTVFEKLEIIEVFRSKEEISEGGIGMINKQPNLKYLGFTYSEADFNDINNSTVEKIIISASSVKNLQSVADCGDLKELILTSSKADGFIIAEEKNGNDKEKLDFFLRDSSCFSVLDNVEELGFYSIYVEDASGLADMASLKRVKVSNGFISGEARKLLEEKGIDVIEESVENVLQ
ncbi:MAG: hypothetical protein K2H93_00270 [Oscillospiraceae bacterium]|nr:hypothetical protein [Oscillospiraceae bacterium]